METVYCENCHTDIPNTSWIMHELSCRRNRWFCETCNQAFPKNEQQQHIDDFHAIIKCDCGTAVEISELGKHKQNDCSKRLVACMYCECPLFIHDIMEHEVVCGARTEPCELCGVRVQLQHLDGHICQTNNIDSDRSGNRDIDSDEDSDTVMSDSESVNLNPPPSPTFPQSQPQPMVEDLIICPFCMAPSQDYDLLQEHIFDNHPDQLEE